MGKLYKSKSMLPDWFPLKVYGQDLTDEEWLNELVVRYAVKQMHRKGSDKVKSTFTRLIVNNERSEDELVDTPDTPGQVWGIKELSAYELLYLSKMASSSPKAQPYLEEIEKARSKKEIETLISSDESLHILNYESFGSIIDWNNEPFDMQDVIPRFPVSIDLEQDDETLKLAFEIWLAGVRGEAGTAKKAFCQKDFDEWKKFGVLQVFDLKLWASLENAKYTNKLLADTLWPLDEEDTTERLRKVTSKKLDFLLSDWTNIGRLWKQVSLSKSLTALMDKKVE